MNEFEEQTFSEFFIEESKKNNVIKSNDSVLKGKTKISIEEEGVDGVKFILKKDENDILKEIKFVCSCGQTKTIILDYNE